MNADKILAGVLSLGGILFTYWFFLMRNEKETAVTSDSVKITVNGGYNPEIISIPSRKTTYLKFTRTDSSSCLEEVVLGDFNIRKTLPLNKEIIIPVTPNKTGEYVFTCGMNMFHGKLRVI